MPVMPPSNLPSPNRDSCASKPTLDEVLSSEGTRVSPGPNCNAQSEETHKHVETGLQASISPTSSFPYLKESELTRKQLEGLSIRLRMESEENFGTCTPESMSHCISEMFL